MKQKYFLHLFIGLILVACFLSFFLLFLNSGNYLLLHDPRAIDFLAFSTGGQLIGNDPSQLYNLHLQQVLQNQILPITKNLTLFIPFLNPPFVALFFMPLSKVGIFMAYAIWLFINFLIVLTISYLLYKKVHKYKLRYKFLFIIAFITFVPILTTFLTGQLSLVLCLILIGSWLALQKEKLFLSGFLFSLLLIKPHFLLIPFFAHLMQRRKHFLIGFFLGISILTLISFFLVGWQGMTSYLLLLTNVTSWTANYRIDLLAQHSIQTVLLLLFQTTNLADIRLLWILVSLLFVIPTLYVWRKQYPLHSEETKQQWALLIVTLLLTSPHTHFHDLTLLLILPFLLEPQQQYLMLFIAGYCIALLGYLITVWTGTWGNHLWIVIDVLYQVCVWFIILSKFLNVTRGSKK